MRRRVELAKGLLNHPDVLLLDEPSTGLDPAARIDLWRALAEVRAAGVTVLVTTHLMDEADRCDRLAVLAAGKLLACDAPAALKGRIGGDVITVQTRDPDGLAALLRDRLGVEAERVDDALRLERDRGWHDFVPRVIEAAPGLVDSIAVGQPDAGGRVHPPDRPAVGRRRRATAGRPPAGDGPRLTGRDSAGNGLADLGRVADGNLAGLVHDPHVEALDVDLER